MSGKVSHALLHPWSTSKKLAHGVTHPIGTAKDLLGLKMPEMPEMPGVPTIDQAAMNQQVTDRILRRRGVLATMFGGASSGTPSVGKTTLGGA
jgi:hypothetical protein